MEYKELLLKTVFCTMACDGDIAEQEIQCVKKYVEKLKISDSLNVEETLKTYVSEINALKQGFIDKYFKEIIEQSLSIEQELEIAKASVDIILADEVIEYSEIKFFKKLRSKLNVSDEEICRVLPEDSDNPNIPTKEDFLAPDVFVKEEDFLINITFEEINLESKAI